MIRRRTAPLLVLASMATLALGCASSTPPAREPAPPDPSSDEARPTPPEAAPSAEPPPASVDTPVPVTESSEAPAPAPQAPSLACDDPALSEAAAALLGLGSAPLTEPALVAAVRAAADGSVSLRATRGPVAAAAHATLAREAVAREGALAVCGEAELDGVLVRVVGRRGARLTIAAGPRGARVVGVALLAGLREGELVVRADDGEALRRTLTTDALRLDVPAAFATAFVVQVVGRTEAGPLPVAELRVGALPDAEATPPDESVPDHVVRLRQQAGVPALRGNALLDQVASRHARSVCAEGRATHGPTGDGPVERVRAAGLEARLVGEVVAVGRGRADVLHGIDVSPSHRLELERPEHTDVGYALENVGDRTCVVIVLASYPRFVGR